MSSINRVVEVGRLTKNPELKQAGSTACVNFTIAVNRVGKSAEKQPADFINCVVFGKTAENLVQYQKKGSLIGVEGKLQSRIWDDTNGTKHYDMVVFCESVSYLEKMDASQQTGAPQQYAQQPQQQFAQPQAPQQYAQQQPQQQFAQPQAPQQYAQQPQQQFAQPQAPQQYAQQQPQQQFAQPQAPQPQGEQPDTFDFVAGFKDETLPF